MISEMILVESMSHFPVTIFGIIYEYARYRSILLLGGSLSGLNYLITFSPFYSITSSPRTSSKGENKSQIRGCCDDQLLSCDLHEVPRNGISPYANAENAHGFLLDDNTYI
jgi:hypothetical protein